MKSKGATIRDVAQHAGVSVGMASYILNGRYDGTGSEKRDRVLEAVKQLNYRPNAIARSMVTRATATIGLIISELKNPLFVPVTEGVQEILGAQGYHIVLAEAPDIESEIKAIETLRAQQVDGFIFMSLSFRYPSQHLNQLKDEGVPFVVINRDLDDPQINLVRLDDLGAGYMATRHLVELGHTQIAAINGAVNSEPPRRSAVERYEGFKQALQERDLTLRPEWMLIEDYGFERGYRAAQKLVARLQDKADRPTALFIADDTMAIGALKAFYEVGVRIPHDLAVVTIGDPPAAAYSIPSLTTLALPVFEAGKVSARILLAGIKAETAPRPQKVSLSFRLIIRESCGARLKNKG